MREIPGAYAGSGVFWRGNGPGFIHRSISGDLGMRIRSRRGLGATAYSCAVMSLGFFLACQPARADNSSDASAKVIAWANANIGKYNQYIQ